MMGEGYCVYASEKTIITSFYGPIDAERLFRFKLCVLSL